MNERMAVLAIVAIIVVGCALSIDAGTISCSTNLSNNASGFASHRYVEYNGIEITFNFEHNITNTAASASGQGTAPYYSAILYYEGPKTPPNCYKAVLQVFSADGNAGATSTEYCLQGPPPPNCRIVGRGATSFGLVTGDPNCLPSSPIVIDLGSGGYELTGLEDTVWFDINGGGTPERITWTAANAPMAFLARDLNGNGTIDSGRELFGNSTALPDGTIAVNGFEALKPFDVDHDGLISGTDPIWQQLLLWTDNNHNGVSEVTELSPISDSTVNAISTDYRWAGRRDRHGNQLRYVGAVWFQGKRMPQQVFDVFFQIGY